MATLEKGVQPTTIDLSSEGFLWEFRDTDSGYFNSPEMLVWDKKLEKDLWRLTIDASLWLILIGLIIFYIGIQ